MFNSLISDDSADLREERYENDGGSIDEEPEEVEYVDDAEEDLEYVEDGDEDLEYVNDAKDGLEYVDDDGDGDVDVQSVGGGDEKARGNIIIISETCVY
jgi:hypothetical protein